jgi:hypothetical protein
MRHAAFRSLLDDAACRMEMLSAIGQQLRARYSEQEPEPMPERLRSLLERLTTAETLRSSR